MWNNTVQIKIMFSSWNCTCDNMFGSVVLMYGSNQVQYFFSHKLLSVNNLSTQITVHPWLELYLRCLDNRDILYKFHVNHTDVVSMIYSGSHGLCAMQKKVLIVSDVQRIIPRLQFLWALQSFYTSVSSLFLIFFFTSVMFLVQSQCSH